MTQLSKENHNSQRVQHIKEKNMCNWLAQTTTALVIWGIFGAFFLTDLWTVLVCHITYLLRGKAWTFKYGEHVYKVFFYIFKGQLREQLITGSFSCDYIYWESGHLPNMALEWCHSVEDFNWGIYELISIKMVLGHRDARGYTDSIVCLRMPTNLFHLFHSIYRGFDLCQKDT